MDLCFSQESEDDNQKEEQRAEPSALPLVRKKSAVLSISLFLFPQSLTVKLQVPTSIAPLHSSILLINDGLVLLSGPWRCHAESQRARCSFIKLCPKPKVWVRQNNRGLYRCTQFPLYKFMVILTTKRNKETTLLCF